MKIKKNGKVFRLTESDLKKIVKRTLKEQQQFDFEEMENPAHKPITLESIKQDITDLFDENPGYIETVPLGMTDRVIDDLAKYILESFNYNLDYMTEQYEGVMEDIINKYSR